MNRRMCAFIIGWVLRLEAVLMVPAMICAVYYREAAGLSLLWSALICMAAGLVIAWKRPEDTAFYAREGLVTVALSWVVMSVFGSLPFVFSGAIPNPVNALFETVSGFTTTGASILSDVESLPRCILFWRSFTHWIGGMGVLVFLLTLLPLAGGSPMNLMRAESPGPSVGRLLPRVQSTAKILYKIYIGMTLTQFVLLLIARMPAFDAMLLTFGTAGTGGFGVLNDSLGSYTAVQQGIVTVFMILFGVNFSFYFLILAKNAKQAFKIEEIRLYLAIIVICIAAIATNLILTHTDTPLSAMHHAAFQVGSIMTTTGYSTRDFSAWPEFSRTILLLLMMLGACAGSTGGGFKVARLLILFKTVRKEVTLLLHPHSVKRISMDGKPMDGDVIRGTQVFLTVYVLIFLGSFLLISLDGFSTMTNFSAVAATIGNIGPGLDLVGPAANYSFFSVPAKLVLILDMLAGRLELFPLLVLFFRGTWKKF
ncbi:MAG: TrkH family potassium uptake protein [Lachnospiraceae bacterium]|nr:TrkH family potassium uptake protein [Lachnospiraceae bacterium]